jgi:hypothetical protein
VYPRYVSLIKKGEYEPHPVFYPDLERAIDQLTAKIGHPAF